MTIYSIIDPDPYRIIGFTADPYLYADLKRLDYILAPVLDVDAIEQLCGIMNKEEENNDC